MSDKQPDLKRSVHELIDEIVRCAEDPACWPLSQQDQVNFFRKTFFKARQIARSEAYVNESVAIAAEDLTKFTKKK